MQSDRKIWLLSEVYYPDEQGSAHYTTGLAEALAKYYSVGVICSYPTVTARGMKVPSQETRNGVCVERCAGTTFDKNVFPLRLINVVTFTSALFVKALKRIRKGDIVMVVTSPPSIPFIAELICILRGSKCILRLEDIYPDILAATNILTKESFVYRAFEALNRWLYQNVDFITVLGRDMQALAEKKTGGRTDHIHIIRSWADTDIVHPVSAEHNQLRYQLGLREKFIVSCVGNMGRAQAIELIFDAIEMLKNDDRIHFLFIGSGAKMAWMQKTVVDRTLKNVTLLGQQPRDNQLDFLNAFDISIVSLLPGMTGAGVPSRMYNIMAAGKPIISLAADDSEVSLVVREEDIGWVVRPDNAEALVDAIRAARSSPERLAAMGRRAAALAREKFSKDAIVAQYLELIDAAFGTTT